MSILELTILIFSILYLLFILFILIGIFKKTSTPISLINQPQVSVIIPFKNEEQHLLNLLKSFNSQSYELVEYIFVNDHSNDKSVEIIQSFNKDTLPIKLIHLGNNEQGKKAAITTGIRNSTSEYILTTDADCTHHKDWIKSHLQHLQNKKVVTGVIEIEKCKGLWNSFQQIEMMAIQSVSLGLGKMNLPISMSGANLSYKKKVFEELKPFDDNIHVRSGDDIYFLQKLKKAHFKISFGDEDAIRVKTEPLSPKAYFSQRIRWMKKSSSFSDFTTVLAGLFIFISSVSFVFLTGYQLFTQECNHLFLISAGIKILVDFLLLFLVGYRWEKKSILIWFLPSFLIGVFIHSLLPFIGWFIKVNWKGRTI